MAKAERVLRLSGVYYRKEGVSEEEFHRFSRHHAVACAKIHEKYGILKYQIAFGSSSARELAKSMKTPYKVNDHDLEIEYYFKDVASLLAVSADQEFKDLHIESEPYVRHDISTVTMTWIEVYLDNGKVVNVNSEGQSLYPSFTEMSDIKVTDEAVANYYEK